MSFSSSFQSSSSSYSSIDDSSVLRLKANKDCYLQYKKERKNLKKLHEKGKTIKMKESQKKNQNIESRKKFIEEKEKIKKKQKNKKENLKGKSLNESKADNGTKECIQCHKIIRPKNFFYHDAFIHNGENLNFKQKRRALNTFIKKKLKKINIIYSDIMDNAKRLKIDSFNSPELLHIEKIGFHVMKFQEKKEK